MFTWLSRRCEFALALLLSCLATGTTFLAAGVSFGLALGAFFTLAILLPPLLTTQDNFLGRVALSLTCVAGIAPWLIPFRLTEIAAVLLVLTGFALALAGSVAILTRLHFTKELAAASIVLFALTWLTWPIWLSPHIAGRASPQFVNTLVLLHPPLAANGALASTTPWTEQTLAYQLTALDQDIPLKLPDNPLPCTLLHAGLGLTLLMLAGLPRRRP